jgi:catechol 1,2-dioxygenase
MITRREVLGGAAAVFLTGLAPQDRRLALTEDNIEGPFYRKGAPFRNRLAAGLKGAPLRIAGKVLSPDGTPLRDALVDVWQADREGAYDTTSDAFVLRGRIRADANGLYAYETIMPGQYDLGEAKRPAHIHYKVSAGGHAPLTTQLYFKGDPWLVSDPFVRKSLVIELKESAGTFDVVLAKA